MVAVVPVPQSNVTPVVVEEVVRVILVTEQVRVAGGAMPTLGLTIF